MADRQNGAAPEGAYDPLQVNLPVFDGPLDLLLHLVRKQSLDINELRMAELTEPYLAYVEQLKELDLDKAGEFLTIASTLIWIKSKGLLPRNFEEEDMDPETVEEMLVLRLREYQKIKDAAHDIASLDLLGRDIFPRQEAPDPAEKNSSAPGGDLVFDDVSLISLINAFREVLERTQSDQAMHVIPDLERVEDRLGEILELLRRKKTLLFQEMFPRGGGRPEIILTFIALLELVRLKALRVIQANPGGEIVCEVTETFSDSSVDWKEKVVGSMFDWRGAAAPAKPE